MKCEFKAARLIDSSVNFEEDTCKKCPRHGLFKIGEHFLIERPISLIEAIGWLAHSPITTCFIHKDVLVLGVCNMNVVIPRDAIQLESFRTVSLEIEGITDEMIRDHNSVHQVELHRDGDVIFTTASTLNDIEEFVFAIRDITGDSEIDCDSFSSMTIRDNMVILVR